MTTLNELKQKFKVNKDKVVEATKEEHKENFLKSAKLENGKNRVRILPFTDGSIVKKFAVHMNLGVPFLCPKKTSNDYCPSCDFGWKLFNENGKKHSKDEKGNDISKSFLSQDKFVFQLLFRAKEESDIQEYGHPKIRFYDASPTLATKLLSYFVSSDDDQEDVGDLIDGYDVILTRDDTKAKQRQQSTDCDLARKSTPVLYNVPVDDPKFIEMVESMFADAPSILDRFEVKSADEIRELMARQKGKLSKESSSDDSSEFEDTSSEFKDAASSIDNDIDELF